MRKNHQANQESKPIFFSSETHQKGTPIWILHLAGGGAVFFSFGFKAPGPGSAFRMSMWECPFSRIRELKVLVGRAPCQPSREPRPILWYLQPGDLHQKALFGWIWRWFGQNRFGIPFHFGVGAGVFVVGIESDVHWGYGILTHGHFGSSTRF